jgi:hypothetical protein
MVTARVVAAPQRLVLTATIVRQQRRVDVYDPVVNRGLVGRVAR